MKWRRIIYLVLGIILILINLLLDLGEYKRVSENYAPGESIAYWIGFNFPLFIGLLLLRSAYKLNKRLKKKEEANRVKNLIDNIGRP